MEEKCCVIKLECKCGKTGTRNKISETIKCTNCGSVLVLLNNGQYTLNCKISYTGTFPLIEYIYKK